MSTAGQPWLPPLWELVPQLDVVTRPFAYVRLLGDREAVERHTKTFDHLDSK